MSPDDQQLFKGAYESFSHKRFDDCIKALRKLIKLKVKTEQVYNLLGLTYSQKGKYKESLQAFRDALKLNSKSSTVFYNIAKLYEEHGKFDLAENSYRRSISCQPTNTSSILNLGLCLQKQDQWLDAETVFDEFLIQGGDIFEGNIRKAVCIYGRHLYKEAQDVLDIAKQLNPNHKAVRYYQAMIFDKTDQKNQAEPLFKSLIDENHYPSFFSLGLLYFSIGKWKEAFELNENRSLTHEIELLFQQPGVESWKGQSLKDKTVLLLHEQGIGDQIRYLFFIHSLLNEAKKIYVYLDERLYPLINSTFDGITCLTNKKVNKQILNDLKIDFTMSIGSLGVSYYSTIIERQTETSKTIINSDQIKYLQADRDREAFWKIYLIDESKPVIGICWRSVKLIIGRNDWYLDITQVADIFKGLDVKLVNLQYGATDQEISYLESQGLDIVSLDKVQTSIGLNLKDDQAELAAILSNVDLVVSSATSLSELSSALGIPTFVFAIRDLKWFHSDKYMGGFHPVMKLFFKDVFDDWNATIIDLRDSIKEKIQLY